MTVDEALEWAGLNGHSPEVRSRLRSRAVAWTLAAEVRRLRVDLDECRDDLNRSRAAHTEHVARIIERASAETARLRQQVADLEALAGQPYIEPVELEVDHASE